MLGGCMPWIRIWLRILQAHLPFLGELGICSTNDLRILCSVNVASGMRPLIHGICEGSWKNGSLVGGFNPSETYESQLGLVFPIYGKIIHVPNHQPNFQIGDTQSSPKLVSIRSVMVVDDWRGLSHGTGCIECTRHPAELSVLIHLGRP